MKADTRFEVDPNARAITIDVNDDAPDVIRLETRDILPIQWIRNGERRGTLPAATLHAAPEIILIDHDRRSHALPLAGELPAVRVDPAAYAAISTWQGQPDPTTRRRTAWIGVLFSIGLLLLLMLPKWNWRVGLAYCAAWGLALGVLLHRRSTLFERDDADAMITWYFASRAQTLRVPIDQHTRWVPVVESVGHIQALSPLVEVEGRRAWIQFTLPANAKIGLTRDVLRDVRGETR